MPATTDAAPLQGGRAAWLFIYGTLLAQTDTMMSRWLAERTRASLEARVKGRLMAIKARSGWYPALVTDTKGTVAGRLLQLGTEGAAWRMLDSYEGLEYRRTRLRAFPLGEMPRLAFAYVWRSARPASAIAIKHGDFARWLRETGHPAYGARPSQVDR